MATIAPEDLFLLGIGFVCAVLLYLPLLVAMHLLMPAAVVERYWKQPYFGPFELGMFSHALYRLLRTQKFIAAMVFTNIAKKRGIDQGWPVPRWYLRAAQALIAWGLFAFAGFVSVLAGFYLHMVANDLVPSPAELGVKGKTMLAVFIACVVFLVVQSYRSKRTGKKPHRVSRSSGSRSR